MKLNLGFLPTVTVSNLLTDHAAFPEGKLAALLLLDPYAPYHLV